MKELDFTGEWLTRDGSYAQVEKSKMSTLANKRYKFFGNIGETKEKRYGTTHWDADGKCLGFPGWDLQKRLDRYTNE